MAPNGPPQRNSASLLKSANTAPSPGSRAFGSCSRCSVSPSKPAVLFDVPVELGLDMPVTGASPLLQLRALHDRHPPAPVIRNQPAALQPRDHPADARP